MTNIDPRTDHDMTQETVAASPDQSMQITSWTVESSAGASHPRPVSRQWHFPQAQLLMLAKSSIPIEEGAAATMARVAAEFDSFDPGSNPGEALAVAFKKAYDHRWPRHERGWKFATDLMTAFFDLKTWTLYLVSAGHWRALIIRDGCRLMVSRITQHELSGGPIQIRTFGLQVGDQLLFGSRELNVMDDLVIVECLSGCSPRQAGYNLIKHRLYYEHVLGKDNIFTVIVVGQHDDGSDHGKWPESAPQQP